MLSFGPDEGDIFYTESNDGGVTWLNPPLRVNDDTGTNDQTHCWIDIKPNGTVDVVWYDKRNDPMDRNPEVFFAAMPPGAGTFTANLPVSNLPILAPAAGFWIGDYIGVVVDEQFGHIAWADNRQEGFLFDAFYAAQENPDVTETAACCLPDNLCVEMTEGECLGAGGRFLRNYPSCVDVDCEVAGVGEGGLLPGGKVALLRPSYPNPFNPGTNIQFELGRALPVRLTVYDLAGRRIRELYHSPLQDEGSHSVYWNGRDDGGRSVSAGVYFCRMNAGGTISSIRMALIK